MKLLRVPGSVFILLLSFLAMSLSASVPLAWAAVGTITEFPIPTSGSDPTGITLGPDGKMWFTEFIGNKIGLITTNGTITEFTMGLTVNSEPAGITAGPDGNLWFTEVNANQIGSVTTGGTFAEFPIPNSGPSGIASGRGGKVWFTESNTNQIGHISTK